MKRMQTVLSASFFGVLLAGSAVAAPITYNNVFGYETVIVDQGKQCQSDATGCKAVDAARSDYTKMFDGNATFAGGSMAGKKTFFSLGIADAAMTGLGLPDPNPGFNATASVQVQVQDGYKIAGGSMIEMTFGVSGESYPEQAKIYLGNDLGGYQLVATIRNNGVISLVAGAPVSIGSSKLSADGFIFDLQVTDGTFDSLMIADDTMAWKEAFWDNTHGDGWDITTLSITSVKVPEPATLMLLGAGLAGISLIRRRSKR